MATDSDCISAYRRHKNLKVAAKEVGIAWQNLYCRLRAAGEQVTGDKERYGSEKDRFAARAESEFHKLVPFAEDMNQHQFQPRYDFDVHGLRVDVKASNLHQGHHRTKFKRWAFSVKKQEPDADFFVLFAFNDDQIDAVLLIPGEVARKYQTIHLSDSGRGKWWDYKIDLDDLAPFFTQLASAGSRVKDG